jgi:Protein of unknown function (DUF2490)
MHRGAGVHFHELRPWRIVVVAAWLAATLPMAAYARAADATELWPELSAYVGLSKDTRLFLDASYARGKESDLRTLELSAYLDVALAPMLRLELRKEDWQRARYLWVRVGYSHIGKVSAGDAQEPERRGVLALYARAPLPLEFWLEGRLRTDLRWIGNDYSTRYRARVDLSRDYRWLERPLMSYANAEVFYDTGQSGFNRTLYQIGTEVTVDKNFRYEVYLAWQSDRLPAPESLLALGLVAKWYF